MRIPVSKDLSLLIGDEPDDHASYPTSRLPKGLLLSRRGLNLAEEAVGFGVPVLKLGLQTVFAGQRVLELLRSDSVWVIGAVYTVNLVRRILPPGGARKTDQLLLAAQNTLSAVHRGAPLLRSVLAALSSGLAERFGWKTSFEAAGFSAEVKMTYTFDGQTRILGIEADLARLPQGRITEAIVMNEQGAHYFNQYRDLSGHSLLDERIGTWDEVSAEEATFGSSSQRVAFTLHQVPGARLFRGRELIGSRLAWSGFGYSFSPTTKTFRCTVRIEEL